MPSDQIDITKNARTIEWLKTELLNGVASLHRALIQHREDAVLESLADTVITTYLLGRRLGVSFSRLDAKMSGKLRLNVEERHQVEQWYGDLSALLEHLDRTVNEL